MAGRHKKYQNLFGTSVFYTVKHYQRVWGETERKTIKKLYAQKELSFRPLDNYDRESLENYKRITEQNKNKSEGDRKPVNVYAAALMQPIHADNWDKVTHTTSEYGAKRFPINALTLKRQFDTEKKELVRQQLNGIEHGYKNCGCKPEMNCNGRHELKRLLLSCYWYDSRFDIYSTADRITKIIQFLDCHLDNMAKPDIEQFMTSDELKWLLFFCYFCDPRFRIYSVTNKTTKIMQFLDNKIDSMSDHDIEQFLNSEELLARCWDVITKSTYIYEGLEETIKPCPVSNKFNQCSSILSA